MFRTGDATPFVALERLARSVRATELRLRASRRIARVAGWETQHLVAGKALPLREIALATDGALRTGRGSVLARNVGTRPVECFLGRRRRGFATLFGFAIRVGSTGRVVRGFTAGHDDERPEDQPTLTQALPERAPSRPRHARLRSK